jgi:hypothetical protein
MSLKENKMVSKVFQKIEEDAIFPIENKENFGLFEIEQEDKDIFVGL